MDSAETTIRGRHDELTQRIIGVFYDVYNELGGGFLESVYHAAMALALRECGLQVMSQVPVPVHLRGAVVGDFRADLTVGDRVLLELKAVSAIERNHEAQLLHYLRATTYEVGILLNFGPRAQFKRIVLNNRNKKIRVDPRSSAVDSFEVQA